MGNSLTFLAMQIRDDEQTLMVLTQRQGWYEGRIDCSNPLSPAQVHEVIAEIKEQRIMLIAQLDKNTTKYHAIREGRERKKAKKLEKRILEAEEKSHWWRAAKIKNKDVARENAERRLTPSAVLPVYSV
jgi:hypothetical protein